MSNFFTVAIAAAAQPDSLQELLDHGPRLAEPQQNTDGSPTTVQDLFRLHHSFLDKLMKKDGEKKGLIWMCRILSQVKVFSLFSGLGGTELAIQQLYQAVKEKCDELNLDTPEMPENILSCDVDPVCQKVLASHRHPSRYIVDDMMRFLSPRCSLALLCLGSFVVGSNFKLIFFDNWFNFKVPTHDS